MSQIPLALLLTLGLAMSGCQNKTENLSQPPQQPGATASPPATDPGAVAVPGGTASPPAADEAVVVRELTPGDRACYVKLEDGQGQISEEEASFELCEQAQLIGKRVRLTRESTQILAASCGGDPECKERDTVDLIVAAEVLP
ncbi:MAG TPA: hypothetical protein V6D29_02525 [Leptolyngbyaceae cyanobacterium]